MRIDKKDESSDALKANNGCERETGTAVETTTTTTTTSTMMKKNNKIA